LVAAFGLGKIRGEKLRGKVAGSLVSVLHAYTP
jgi:hypothetical protein